MNPAPMPVAAALYAALVALLLIVLAVRVSRLRLRHRIGIGDGANPELLRAIRVHANAVEWALPGLILLLAAELNRAAPVLIHACGIALVAGRLLHAIGLGRNEGRSFGRSVGSLLTWGAILVLALWNVYAFARLALL